MVLILTEPQLRRCIGVNHEALDAVADGFNRLAAGQATMPPIMRLDVAEHNGEVDVKTAYLQGLDGFAVKLSSGFFNNHKLGLPSLSGLMILLSARTGFPQALLLDNGYLTDVRTGMAGALAARHLAPEQVSTAGVIGAGAQARYQMRALQLVRDFKRVLVYSRTPQNTRQYAEEMAASLERPVEPVASAEAVVRHSDVVVTTTPAKDPYLRAEWLHPGLHITAMGSDAEEKQELHPDVFRRAGLIVCDRKSQALRLGELHHAHDAGALPSQDQIIELGQLTSGELAGRQSSEQITICDLTGTGVQDTAIALLAYHKARELGLGQQIDA
ncbi:MAG TPA: cyclodeaminase [Candidatus Sulfomarinibacteraceae bacterium]|nr:cyclodeaminase [Candidatus Sulfomarinibacteraceae bacterium]